ncbi:MAG: 50S ribosomal protein L23 [Candidatus Magasanikbacteria bacterium]|nr:50S ribosomal protein L23 [Candidatus Magasanikbacteria bacterium]
MGILDRFKKTKRNPDLEERLSGAKKSSKGSSAQNTAVRKNVSESGNTDSVGTQKVQEKIDSSDTKSQGRAKHGILISPLVSEKATDAERTGVYTFKVARKASKMEIKNAVKAVYGVVPVMVRTVTLEGKRMRFSGNHGKRSDWKKALVTLPKGASISIHEGV